MEMFEGKQAPLFFPHFPVILCIQSHLGLGGGSVSWLSLLDHCANLK